MATPHINNAVYFGLEKYKSQKQQSYQMHSYNLSWTGDNENDRLALYKAGLYYDGNYRLCFSGTSFSNSS